MNTTINARRYARRFAGVVALVLASTCLNGCIVAQLLAGGLGGAGALLGGGQTPPGTGPLTGPVTTPLPGPGGEPPVVPPPGGTTPVAGEPAAPQLPQVAANLSEAAKADVRNRDADIQSKYAALIAVYRDRKKYIDERATTPDGTAARQTLEATITDRNNQFAAAEKALNDAVAARNRVAAGGVA